MLSALKRFSQCDTNLGKIYFKNIRLEWKCFPELLLNNSGIHSCLSSVLFGRSSGILREIWLSSSEAPEELAKKCRRNILEMSNQIFPNVKEIRRASIKIFFPGWYRTGKTPLQWSAYLSGQYELRTSVEMKDTGEIYIRSSRRLATPGS